MATEPITGAEIIVKALIDQGVEVIFGYPGGAVLPLYDALFKQNQIRHILVRHEQAAVHAAEGYARSTGRVGVVLVTSGPGATNAVTGLTDALMDSIPLVCLTGQVPTHLIGNDAFQEADTTGITRPCTKHNYLVKSVGDLSRKIHEAFYVAKAGRPGPVVVDLPKDVQQAKYEYVNHAGQKHRSYNPPVQPRPPAGGKGDRADGQCQEAAVLHRRRLRQFRSAGLPAAGRFHPPDRFPLHPDPDGPRRLPRLGSAVAGHGRHARHVRIQLGDARLRRDDQHRRQVRRPRHRPHRRLRAELEEDPCRHRSLVDQQERPRRRAGGGRRRACDRGDDADLEGPPDQAERQGAGGLVGADQQVAVARLPEVPQLDRGDQAAISRCSASMRRSRTATSTSPPRSASTRCGRRSSSSSRSRTAG